ncbi:hypothetical protein CGRA01v4_01431 [Colletotrichum graminicola]|nr:hypothetical protein CGRA01v4_01431 [Colletotrichum graminicola]
MFSTITRTEDCLEEALGFVVPASSFVPRSTQTQGASSSRADTRSLTSCGQPECSRPPPPLQPPPQPHMI